MSETRKNLDVGLLALVPIACCISIPLIAAAGISVALAGWAGGIALAALVLLAAVVLLVLPARRHRATTPPISIPRSRS